MPWTSGDSVASSLITGVVDNFVDLPAAGSHPGELWFVKNNSSAFFPKYPRGLYYDTGSSWDLTPIKVKWSEDAGSLINWTDWSQWIAGSEDVGAGDRLIYSGIEYINITGAQTSTAPDTDTTNWTVLNELLKSLEFLATGNTASLENDNWKIETSGIYLIFYRRQNNAWIEVFRTGASLETDRFIINTTGGSLVFDNNLGQTRTLIKPSVDENGAVVGNGNGRVAFIHSGELFSVNIDNSEIHELTIQNQTTESDTGTDFSIELTSSQVQAVISGEISLANVPANTKVRFSVLSENDVLLAQNVREFEFQNGGDEIVTNGLNTLAFSEELVLPAGYIFKVRLESNNTIDLQGKTVDLGDGRGSRFVPYLKVEYFDGVEENVTTSHNIVSQLTNEDIVVKSLSQPVFGDETGLVLDIPFEQYGTDTIQEDKSLSHKGVGSGGVIASANNGQYGSGGLFDGIDDKIDIPYDAILNPVIFTAEVRVKVTGGAGAFRSPLTSREASPKKGYTIYANDNNIWQLLFSDGTANWQELNGPAVVLDKWTNVSISYDGTTMSLYVDNVLVDSAISSYSPNTQFPTRIGAGATEGSGQFFFNGNIDHVKMYSKALAIEEIKTPYLRHGGKSVIKSDYYRIIDSNNNVIFEVSPDLFKYNDANGGRALIDVSKIQLVSPDASALVNIRNADIEFYIATQLMLELNAISAKVTSPDGTKTLTVNNDGVNADSSLYQSIFGDESQLMLDIPFSHGGTNIVQFNRGNRENILSGFGGVITSSFNGPFNGPSATFNGTTAYMNNLILEGINLNAFQNLTVEGWAKSTDITTGNYMWILEGTHASDWESFLLEPTGSNQVGVFFRDGSDAIGVTILATVDDVTQWHRYTVILDRDADVIKIYVDGVLKNTGSISSESAGFTQPIKLGLGALPDGSGNFWQGQQTEFRVYNKKLSLDEIRIYYARTGGDSVIQGDVFRTVNLFNHVNLEVSEYLFNYIDSGTSRIIADATKTKSVSPDGLKSHEINNSGHLLIGLKSGTLVAPPTGLAINEIWEDTTDSTTHPIIRKSTVAT